MDSSHKIQITYDDGSGTLSATHRCTVLVGSYAVSHSRPVELPESVARALKGLIEENRSEVQEESESMALAHIAALSGRTRPNVKSLKVGGNLSLFGDAVKKGD